jgi:predicted porin
VPTPIISNYPFKGALSLIAVYHKNASESKIGAKRNKSNKLIVNVMYILSK